MIRIVTDSSADLPEAVAAEYRISVVPLTILFGDDTFLDGVDLTPTGFWERLATSDLLPETTSPTAGAFVDTFERLGGEGADGVVAVCLSAALSGTYQSAVLAAEKVELPVRVVDSRTVSMALGLSVLAAARAAESASGIDEVAAAASSAANRTNLFAALDTLSYLRRGLRVGAVQALLGRLLDVKLLVTFADGVVVPAGRTVTRRRALEAIVAKAAELGPTLAELAVVHAAAPDLDRLLGPLGAAVPGLDPIVAQLGPVVGTHAGPGAIGIAYRLH